MQTAPRPHKPRPSAFTFMELLVVVAITAVFISATAPIFQEMLHAIATINARQASSSTQETWTNRLRADLWSGAPVTLKSSNKPDTTLSGSGAPIVWVIDPPNPITRTTTPNTTPGQESDGIKTFRCPAKSIALQKQPGCLTLTITQPDLSQPTLYTLPLLPGVTP